MDAKKLYLHCLLIIIHMHHFTFCASIDTVTINQTIKEGNLLISKENKFALGFFSPGSSSYRYLGIWFYQVPVKTVVWVANRNHPINGFLGVLSINQYGNLILQDDHQVPVWSTNVSTDVAGCSFVAQLLDSGNFVLLQGQSRRILWQSFDHPTDTLLPTMKFGLNRITGVNTILTSWRSPDDPGIGDYSHGLNPIGSPQYFLYKISKPYWRGNPWPWRGIPNLFNFSFVKNEDEIYFSYFHHDSSVVLRMVVDVSGMLMWLSWHENESQWKEYMMASKYRCDSYGRCGANSKCDPNHVNTFECACLPGYEPKSPRNWYLTRDTSGGCVRKRLKSSTVCGNGEGFVKVAQVKVPDTSIAAAWVNMSVSRLDCEQECKNNCSCSAYASMYIAEKGTAGCLAWYGELMDIEDLLDNTGFDLYVRVDAIELAEIARSKGFVHMKVILAVSVSSAWLVIIIFAYWLKKRRKRGTAKIKWKGRIFDSMDRSHNYKGTLEMNDLQASRSHPDLEIFSLNTIITATNSFSPANKIGQGGFGSVYKGELVNGKKVAVKRLSKDSGQGIEEFKNEALLIAQLQHRNLVKLLGCCFEREERILIYEYLPNGSLNLFLFDESRRSHLNWRTRFNIIVGIARGIVYLHQDSRLRIIHRDLKSSNILLDAEMNPKISDFGMARILEGDRVQYRTHRVVGTYGYMSPEYAVFGKISIKLDIFSLGVILLEIISGKKSNGCHVEDSALSLVGHVWELWEEDRALEIVDSTIATEESYNSCEVLKCIHIALLCVQEDAVDRPSISAVMLMLDSEMALPPPKQPAFIFRNSCNTSPTCEEQCSINQVTITAMVAR